MKNILLEWNQMQKIWISFTTELLFKDEERASLKRAFCPLENPFCKHTTAHPSLCSSLMDCIHHSLSLFAITSICQALKLYCALFIEQYMLVRVCYMVRNGFIWVQEAWILLIWLTVLGKEEGIECSARIRSPSFVIKLNNRHFLLWTWQWYGTMQVAHFLLLAILWKNYKHKHCIEELDEI